jgi:hypothetical protein
MLMDARANRKRQEIFTEHSVSKTLIDHIAIAEDASMVPAAIDLLPAEPAKGKATAAVGTLTAAIIDIHMSVQ